MSKPVNAWRKVHGKITKRPTNFSWLIEEKLAGSGMPTALDLHGRGREDLGANGVAPTPTGPTPGHWPGGKCAKSLRLEERAKKKKG